MGRDRLLLHEILKDIMETGPETPDVHFQPKTNTLLTYPCIVYKVNNARTLFAGNLPYRVTKRYLVTVIDRDPDSEIPDKVAALPMCVFDRQFTADDLYHNVFTIFF